MRGPDVWNGTQNLNKHNKQEILHPQKKKEQNSKVEQNYLKYEMTDKSFLFEDLTRFLYVVSSTVLYLTWDGLG